MARVLISMPDKFLDEVSLLANKESRNRSELIREALRTYINRKRLLNTDKANKEAIILNELLK